MLETKDYQDTNFGSIFKAIIGCPVMLRDKFNNVHHGILSEIVSDTTLVLECCHKVDPSSESIIFDRSIPKKSNVATRVFEIEQIVELDAYQVDGDYAVKSRKNLKFQKKFSFNYLSTKVLKIHLLIQPLLKKVELLMKNLKKQNTWFRTSLKLMLNILILIQV